MLATAFQIPLALEGEWADFRAVIVVLIGLLAWFVTIYVLLATNLGWRVGYLVLAVALAGWTILLSLIWLIGVPGTPPGSGPLTHQPKWVPFLAESVQGQELADEIARFPDGWDELGQTYAGNIPSQGELETASHTVQEALRHLCYERDDTSACWFDEDVWDWRLPDDDVVATGNEEPPPVGTVRFLQDDTPLLFGVAIPATENHRAQTVFAYRDKGLTFLTALYFLIAGLVGFVVHLGLLARSERKGKEREAALTPDEVSVS